MPAQKALLQASTVIRTVFFFFLGVYAMIVSYEPPPPPSRARIAKKDKQCGVVAVASIIKPTLDAAVTTTPEPVRRFLSKKARPAGNSR